MTAPKFPIPHEIVHHERFTLEGSWFLVPRPGLLQLFGYLHGYAALRTGQQVHAEVLLPDRRAGLLTDFTGNRSDFFRILHGDIGVRWGTSLFRQGGIWDKARPGDSPCLGTTDVEERLLSIWELPLKMDLVERLEDYPGFMVTPENWGRKMRFKRPADCPDHFPEEVVFTPMPPPQYREWPLEEVRSHFHKKICELERKHRKRRKRYGIEPVGRGRCVSLDPYQRPDQPWSGPERAPRYFGSKAAVALAQKEYERKKEQYADAREELKAGRTDALFPAGTIFIPRHFPARVAEPPAHPLTVIRGTVPRARAPA